MWRGVQYLVLAIVAITPTYLVGRRQRINFRAPPRSAGGIDFQLLGPNVIILGPKSNKDRHPRRRADSLAQLVCATRDGTHAFLLTPFAATAAVACGGAHPGKTLLDVSPRGNTFSNALIRRVVCLPLIEPAPPLRLPLHPDWRHRQPLQSSPAVIPSSNDFSLAGPSLHIFTGSNASSHPSEQQTLLASSYSRIEITRAAPRLC